LPELTDKEETIKAYLEKDETKAVINQTLFAPPKVKSKVISSTSTIDIEWAN
jgi:hypothetical protein